MLLVPLKPGASDIVVERADGLLAFASSCATGGATACLSVVADGALPVLSPPRAIRLPAPAGWLCLGGVFVSGVTMGLGSVVCPS